MTLAEFLLARIADDESVAANLIAEGPWSDFHRRDMSGPVRDDELSTLHIGAARVLVECGAKRGIVELYSSTNDHGVNAEAWIVAKAACLLLAIVYDDHPDYRDEWRP